VQLLAEQEASPTQRARAQRGLGVLYQQQGQPERALVLLDDSASFFNGQGDPAELTEGQRAISFVLRDLGQHEAQHAAAVASVEAAQTLR
jgi:hypothetical protein